MAKNPNRPAPRKTVTLSVDEELERLAAYAGRPVSEIVEGIARACRVIPLPYLEELKKSGDVEATLGRVFEASQIGRPIDEQVRRSLKLESFTLEDVDIDFDARRFFLAYDATSDSKETVDTVYVTVDKEGAQLQCSAAVPPLRLKGEFEDVVKLFEDRLLDRMEGYELEYDGDSESGRISLILTPETYEDLPDVTEVSRTFDRLKKFLEKRQS